MFVELRFRQPETWIKDIKLKQRIISALIAIPLFLAIILFAPQSVYLAFWHVCIIACSYEFFKIRGLSKINSLITAAVVGSIAPVVFYLWEYNVFPKNIKATLFEFTLFISFIVPIIWLVIIPILFKNYAKDNQFKSDNFIIFTIWFFIISFFYIFTTLFDIEKGNFTFSRYNLLSMLVIIWANDAGAYFVGKAIGKHKFSPNISPNKTWEGFFGGIVIAVITAAILKFTFSNNLELGSIDGVFAALLGSLFIAIFATIGDLFQSMLKRMAGVKDSGNIMPGHGGVFDRIDSWLAVGSLSSAVFLMLSLLALSAIKYDDDYPASLKPSIERNIAYYQ